MTTILGCDSVVNIHLVVLDSIFADYNLEICNGDSLFLFGEYQSTSRVYTATSNSSVDCDSTTTINLAVLPTFATSTQLFICDNDSVLLENQYRSTPGTYLDTLNSVLGCDSIVTTELSIIPAYQIYIDTVICEGDSINLGDGYAFNAGEYVSAFQALNGCDSLVSLTLGLRPSPISSFSVNILEADMYNAEISFQNLSIGGVSYSWDFNDGSFSEVFEPTHNYLDTGSYTVVLSASSSNGCIDKSQEIITITPVVSIYFPNTFTPNNDGVNDQFFFEGFGITEKDFLFTIYNRWGAVIYETDGFNLWDGTVNGEVVKNGVYIYKAQYIDVNGSIGEKQGHVNLVK